MQRFAEFVEQAQKEGFVRKELDCDMITGCLLDRVVNQIQFAPWIKKNCGTDLLGDPEYKAARVLVQP